MWISRVIQWELREKQHLENRWGKNCICGIGKVMCKKTVRHCLIFLMQIGVTRISAISCPLRSSSSRHFYLFYFLYCFITSLSYGQPSYQQIFEGVCPLSLRFGLGWGVTVPGTLLPNSALCLSLCVSAPHFFRLHLDFTLYFIPVSLFFKNTIWFYFC